MNRQRYYVGLDIGTNSIGYAVTDLDYNIIKFRGRAMWGTRLFDAAETAAVRRVFRTNRRRLQRRKWRIQLLQELFAEEISKVDPGFYQRLKESALHLEDKTIQNKQNLFIKDSEEAEFYDKYPTIYHLRKQLLISDKKEDIRYVYLALHHMMKHRGHFLFSGDVASATSIEVACDTMQQVIVDELGLDLTFTSYEKLGEILVSKEITKRDKANKILQLLETNYTDKNSKKQVKAIINLLCGSKAKLADVFLEDEYQESSKPSFAFSDSGYDEIREELDGILLEKVGVIDSIKALYDWSILSDILKGGEYNGESFLSIAKVRSFEKHAKDLQELKDILNEYDREQYNKLLKDVDKDNYSAYIGYTKKAGKKISVKRCAQDVFYKKVKTVLGKIEKQYENDEEAINKINKIYQEIENKTFLPLQVSKDNGVIPYQIHEMELKRILDNAKRHYSFLQHKDAEGITVADKIEMLFKFRVPYYVGPLNVVNNKNAWMVRKEEGKIYPWNFTEKVDLDESAERFIRRMTNKCTYLIGKDVVPKNSLLYTEFMVLNELNNVKVNGEPLKVELKQRIFDDLFKRMKKVTGKRLVDALRSYGMEVQKEDLSGFDQNFHTSLVSYLDMRKIFGDRIDEYAVQQMCEDFVLWITLYGEDRKMLKRVIRKKYTEQDLTEDELNKVCRLKYQGWGNLSREFLTELEGADRTTGEIYSIMGALRTTNNNLMQLLSDRYTFKETVEELNQGALNWNGKITYKDLMEDMVASPSVKRAIWQTVLIVEEIRKIMKCQPEKIFIEMARGAEEKKRKDSRRERLIKLYANIKSEERDWKKELENRVDSDFRSIKLYLYYTQMGKCMYSGESIPLSKLADTNIYDKDHIFPQSKTKDDSLDNLVLVKKDINSKKSNEVLSQEIQNKMKPFWKMLKEKGLISEKKYYRLLRNTPLTDEELAGFINRQIVETRQSTKLVGELFKKIYDESTVVYVKAGTVSEFRQSEVKCKKVRSLNDLHHAKDAYMNVVVGNVYHEKFTSNPFKWLKSNGEVKKYNLNLMYKYDLIKNDQIIWKRGDEGTIKLVRKNMKRHDIQYTQYATINKTGQNGGFFDQNIVSKDNKASVPIKKGMDVNKYGGYKSLTPAYFALVESEDKKGKKIRSIEAVPLYLKSEIEKNQQVYLEYCKEKYGLLNPKVIISVIKKNTLFKINGFYMHLRGTTGKQLIFQPAVQLFLSEEKENYLKRVEKYIQRNAERADKKVMLSIRDEEKITKKDNVELYEELMKKQKDSIYQYCPANQYKTLMECKKIFEKMSLEDQCILLNEVLHLTQCNPVAANFTLFEKGKSSGVMKKNKIISKDSEVKLINQSVTGLFQNEIDLLK